MNSKIDGVIITPLRQIIDERGKIMHMLRSDDDQFSAFGEIYFSFTHPGVVKAWHQHLQMSLNYAVIQGCIKCVLYDNREGSFSKGVVEEHFMSPDNYYLLTVPPLIWNGWKAVGNDTALVANCASMPHSTKEINRMPPDANEIPYDWGLVFR